MKKKFFLGVILARGGSKRLKNKNLKLLNGKPLVRWSVLSAINSKIFCDVIVSSDSRLILKASGKGALKLFRPQKISGDKTRSETALLHALNWYEHNYSVVDYIVLLQPTSPFRSENTIKKSIKKILKYNEKILVTVKKYSNINKSAYSYLKPFCYKISNKKKDVKKYEINGVLYIASKKYFKQSKNLSPQKFLPFIIKSDKENIDIDTKKDFEFAKRLN